MEQVIEGLLADGHPSSLLFKQLLTLCIGHFPNPIFAGLDDECSVFYNTFLVYFERKKGFRGSSCVTENESRVSDHSIYLRVSGVYVHENCCLGAQGRPLPI